MNTLHRGSSHMAPLVCAMVLALLPSTTQVIAEEPLLKPEESGLIFSRNFKDRTDTKFQLLPAKYQLGKALVLPPSSEWKTLAKQIGIEGDVSLFPLAFAESLHTSSGERYLVVVQLAHKFSGDGFLSPGPEIWANIFTLRMQGDHAPQKVAVNTLDLGGLQHACMMAGSANEKGSGFSVKVEYQSGRTGAFHGELQDDGTVKTKKEGLY